MRATVPARRGTGRRSLKAALAVVVLLLVAAGIAGAVSSAGKKTTTETPAQKLAVIETGQPANADDHLVAQLQTALDELGPKCTDSQDKLAGYATVAHDDMAERGIDEGFVSILQHVRQSIPSNLSARSCKEMFALYTALREKG